MSEDKSQSDSPSPVGKRPSLTRKLSFPYRVRDALRLGTDRVLGTDLAWSSAFILVVLLLLGSQKCGVSYDVLAVGSTAPRDLRAYTDVEAVDHALTEQHRQEARDRIPEVYVHDLGRENRLGKGLASLFEEGRMALETGSRESEGDPRQEARRRLEGRAPDPALDVLLRDSFSGELERTLATRLKQVMSGLVIGSKAILERSPRIVLVHVPGSREEEFADYDSIMDLTAAREQVRKEVRSALKMTLVDEKALADLVAFFVDANVAYDPGATSDRREVAAAAISPVRVNILRGSLLVREGQRIDSHDFARLEAVRQASPGGLEVADLMGLMTVILLLAFFLYRYSLYHQRHFKKVKNLHALLVLALLSTLFLSWVFRWLAYRVVSDWPAPFDQVDLYTYLIPVGAGAILVALLANGRIAMVYSAFAAFLFGGLTGWDFYTSAWALMVQWAGVYAISAYRERAALLRAGLVVGGAGAAAALAMEVLQGTLEPPRALFAAGLAFTGGALGVGLLISYALPLFEGLFNVLTDIRLLELSNVNSPLIAQLAVKAPGSYNHSLVVATLSEEAAKDIGANSLLCRVAAFYHDIGKIRKPSYYVENMHGTNPHDRLSPSMSALIIAAHIKDGIKLAREAGLPQRIIDIIPQHHGTRLMSYFYERAKKTADPSLGPIKEEEFRYPGPKPQSKEAAIFMLADGVEAASRTVDDPTPNRLREVIRKITNAIVLDAQLDECDLTFSDLNRIQQAFLRTLVSFHHQRVDYPGFEFNRPKGTKKTDGSKESLEKGPWPTVGNPEQGEPKDKGESRRTLAGEAGRDGNP